MTTDKQAREAADLINSDVVDAFVKAVRDYSDEKTSTRQDYRYGLETVASLILERHRLATLKGVDARVGEIRTAIDPVSGEAVEIRNDLVHRLRGKYAIGPTLPNGEPEFGWRIIGEPPGIQLEAASVIEQITARLKEVEGERDRLRAEIQNVIAIDRGAIAELQNMGVEIEPGMTAITERLERALSPSAEKGAKP